MTVTDRFALLVLWLRSEPVMVRYLVAGAVTALAKYGVSLSPEATTAVGAVAMAVAAWAARQKVSPTVK